MQGNYFVNVVLSGDAACADVAPLVEAALKAETATITQITAVACTTYSDDVAAPRRMLRASTRSLLDATAAAPATALLEVSTSGPAGSFTELQGA